MNQSDVSWMPFCFYLELCIVFFGTPAAKQLGFCFGAKTFI